MTGRVRLLGVACIIAAFTADQASKALARGAHAELAAGIEVAPIFNLVLTQNRGVSFGLLNVLPAWTLIALSLAIVAFLCVLLWRAGTRIAACGFGLVIGGALGNVCDRVRFGAVTDFLDFHIAGYHWPAFNLADAAIVTGVALLILRRGDSAAWISAPNNGR